MHNLDTLYELCDSVMDELDKANDKLQKAGGEMSAGDAEYLDKLTHTLKSIKTTIAMEEAYGDDYSHDGGYDGGNSYARGRRGNVRRDSMGRYSRDGSNSYARGYDRRGGYSRDDAKAELMQNLREMEMEAKDEETRRMIQKWKRQVEED